MKTKHASKTAHSLLACLGGGILKTSLLAAAIAVIGTMGARADILLQYDFFGNTANAAGNTFGSTYNDAGIEAANITRGAGLGNNNAANNFRATVGTTRKLAHGHGLLRVHPDGGGGYGRGDREHLRQLCGNSHLLASPGVTMACYSLMEARALRS